MTDDIELNDDEKRALKAFTDVLAVEWDEQAGVARIVTLSDVYLAVPEEGQHLCPDREYNLDGEGHCKHTYALETVRGKTGAPEGWLVVEDFDERTEPEFDVSAGLPDFEDFRVPMTDGGEDVDEPTRDEHADQCRGMITRHGREAVERAFDTDDEDDRLVTDGGQVQKPEGVDKFTLHDEKRNATQHFEKRPEAEERQAHAQKELNLDPVIYPPGQHPELDDAPEPETDGGQASAGPMEDCAECGEPVPIREATAGPGGKPIHEECDGDDAPDEGETVVDDAPEPEPAPDADPAPDANHEPEVLSADEVEQYAADLDDRDVGQDPLKWMPGEFVDTIEGTEAINRRGFEVLRYFYNVDLDVEMEVDPEDNDMTHCRFKCVATMDGQDIEAWGTSHVDRGDDPWLLVEMAATRARKRALSIATGAGAVAVAELRNEVEQ